MDEESKLLILNHKNNMVIKATIKIIRKVIVTPTNADVSTQVCVSKEFDWMTIVGSSSGVV